MRARANGSATKPCCQQARNCTLPLSPPCPLNRLPLHLLRLAGSSLFILGVDNPIRIFLHGVLTHRIFEIGIMMCILGNATILALDHPRIDHNSSMKAAINLCDFVFILVFAAEMLLKIIVQGLVLHPHAYLRSKWNVLDGIVTFFGVITLVLKGTGADVSFFRAARSMRALRPLRVAVRFEGLKLVIDSLMAAVPGIGNVILVTFLFYIMFGILGLNLFLGSLWYCEDQIGNQIHPAHYNLDGRRLTDQWCFDNMGPDGGHHWLMCPEGAGLRPLHSLSSVLRFRRSHSRRVQAHTCAAF